MEAQQSLDCRELCGNSSWGRESLYSVCECVCVLLAISEAFYTKNCISSLGHGGCRPKWDFFFFSRLYYFLFLFSYPFFTLRNLKLFAFD